MANRNLFRDLLNPIEDALVSLGRRSIQEYGSVDLLGTKDCSRLVNLAFADAAENNHELVFPAGTYKTTQPLIWPGIPRISGQGLRTTIAPDASDYDWVTFGTGVAAGSGPATGWVRDFRIVRPDAPLAPSGTTAALVLNGIRGTELRNVEVRGAPIGFDMRNNCFGTSFFRCRTLFDFQRVGILLRGPNSGGGGLFGAGNDISFYDCWFQGREAAVWVESNSSNYTFYAGQLGLNNPTPSDDRAVVLTNKRFDDGVIVAGGSSIQLFGTSFEPIQNGYALRAMAGGSTFTLIACPLNGSNALGVIKIAGSPGFALGGDDRLYMANTGVHGDWTLPEINGVPQWMQLNTNVAGTISPYYYEAGTFTGGAINVNGNTTLNLGIAGFLMGSRLHSRCHAMSSALWMHHGCRFKRETGPPVTLQVSYDHGITWNVVDTTLVA